VRARNLIAAVVMAAFIVTAGVVDVVNPEFAFRLGAPAGQTVAPSSGYGFASGLTSLSAADLDQRLNDMKATGVRWIRYDVSWASVQPDSAKTYNWADYDRVTKAARAHGFTVLMIIDFAPPWAAAKGCQDAALCAPADPLEYGKFAGIVAARYKSYGVTDFEIWNEPNINFRFEPSGNPALYVRMLKDSYAAIKRVNAKAVVITGGTSPSGTSGGNYSPQDFVSALYANGAGGWFDAVAAHPYTSPSTPSQATPDDAWGQLTTVHNIMAQHGDGSKQIWITEFGAPTNGPNQPNDHVSEAVQAQIATEAVMLWRSYPWAGPMFWYDFQDDGVTTDTNENFYGLTRPDGSHKPAYDAFVTATRQP